MSEKRTYDLPAGDHAGRIGGEEQIYSVPGSPGEETTVVVTDPDEMVFVESVLGRKPTDVEEPAVPNEANVPEDVGPVEYEDMSKADLEQELKARELETSGTKSEMIERLRAHEGV
jgi:hypothetical protein